MTQERREKLYQRRLGVFHVLFFEYGIRRLSSWYVTGREAIFLLANYIPRGCVRFLPRQIFKSQEEKIMRTTFTFNSNLESFSDYMTRVIAILRAIRDHVPAADGIDYSIELTDEEKLELHQKVLTMAIDEMEKTTGKHCLKRHKFGQDEEDFISNFKIVISDNLLSFNDSAHLEDEEKQYQFSTFLKHLSSEALVLTYAGIHGVTRDVEKKFHLILGIRNRLAARYHIDVYDVTAEMIHEERQELTVKDIKAALDFLDGRMSIDQMMEEDGIEGEAFEDKNNEGPELKNEVMDINVQKLFDLFLDRMSDIEKFFALIEIGCSEKYASMTVSQFSVDPVFINIVEADSRYAKNIKMGDVVIKRPDRHSYTDRDIELKDVKFVGGTVVRYQREQTRFRWAKLKEVLTEDDILGNKSVEYFQEKWDELLNKYNY